MLDTTRPDEPPLTPEELELLCKRAERYAKASAVDVEDSREAVAFVRGSSRHACPLEALREIRPLRKLCRMPLASPIVPGAVHVRGEILSVHDLAAFLDEETPIPGGALLLVVEHGNERIALVADDVIGVETYEPSRLRPLPLTFGSRAGCFQGMLVDGTMLLQPTALLTNHEFSFGY